MIVLNKVSKQYKGILVNKNDSGIYLWVKNFLKLTSNKATSLWAIKNISVSIYRGEIFGIYGANGAGKTTLIKMISGLLGTTSGTVEILGRTDPRHIKDTVSYISTNGWMGLEWPLTARENLILYANLFGISGRRLDEKCNEVLKMLGMTEAQDKFISQLSAGMRQKITIARGLILDRPIIFYDEPSVSLDLQSSRSLRELIQADAVQNQRTAIIASHNTEDLAICNRLMFLSKGEMIALGTPDELKKPLNGIQIIEVKCPNTVQNIDFSSLSGVKSVIYTSVEGKRDYQSIKINAQKGEFSLNTLLDYFIESNIAVLDIKPKEITLQEIYEYYLSLRGEGERNEIV